MRRGARNKIQNTSRWNVNESGTWKMRMQLNGSYIPQVECGVAEWYRISKSSVESKDQGTREDDDP